MSFSKPARSRITPTILALVLVIIVLGAGLVYAIITQTVPSETFGPTAVTSSTCNSPTNTLTNTPNPAPVPSGVITISCGTSPAFSVTTAGSDTPTFALPTSGTGSTDSLYIVPSATMCAVTLPTGAQTLTSGQLVNLAVGTYNYCWLYSNVPTGGAVSSSFTIAWPS